MIIEKGEQQLPRSSIDRGRLAIIGGVAVVAVIVGVVLGGLLLTGQAAALSRAASYVPDGAVMYFEARLDLPGDQRANLRSILERFPAVDPDDVLGDALARTLDEALADGAAPFDYSGDIAPWFDGTMAMALLDYPLNADPMQMQLPSTAGYFGITDVAAANDFADLVRAELESQGSTFTSAEHAGTTVWSMDVEASEHMPMDGLGFAYAITDDQLILGNGAGTVEAALDAAGGSGLDDRDDLGGLLSALPDDRVGLMVMDAEAMLAEMRAELEATQPELADALSTYLDAMPGLSVGAVTFEPDALRLDTVAGVPDEPFAPVEGRRALADRVPADAILFADASGLGSSLQQVIVAAKAAIGAGPMGAEQLEMLEQAESALGADLDEFVAWIGSGAVAAGWDGQQPYFGMVLEATDADAADRRLDQLRALAELGAGEMGGGLRVTSETVSGVEVTTLRVDEMELFASDAALQWAIDDGVVLIGVGDRFVPTAIELDAADSLGSADRYGSAVDRFGSDENSGTFFLDLAGLREAVESAVPIQADAAYQDEIRPNLLPFDYLAGVTEVDGGRVVSRMGIVLR